mgnify:CR=1 FL=1
MAKLSSRYGTPAQDFFADYLDDVRYVYARGRGFSSSRKVHDSCSLFPFSIVGLKWGCSGKGKFVALNFWPLQLYWFGCRKWRTKDDESEQFGYIHSSNAVAAVVAAVEWKISRHLSDSCEMWNKLVQQQSRKCGLTFVVICRIVVSRLTKLTWTEMASLTKMNFTRFVCSSSYEL